MNYLHRLGFVLKRPKKRLLKAKDEERKAFGLQYRQIREEAERIGAKIFFVDEAHFRADADLRGKWVLKGEPALVDSTSPRWGEKACYYSGVCLESGEVEAMEIAGNSNAETSTAFLQQLRENHPGPLVVIWDNGPAHRGEAIRSYLATPDLHLRLVALPAYSPDFNADEAVWDWAREEVTANECLGTKAQVQEKMYVFFGGLAHRKDEVRHRASHGLFFSEFRAVGPGILCHFRLLQEGDRDRRGRRFPAFPPRSGTAICSGRRRRPSGSGRIPRRRRLDWKAPVFPRGPGTADYRLFAQDGLDSGGYGAGLARSGPRSKPRS